MHRPIKHLWPRPAYGPAPTATLWAICGACLWQLLFGGRDSVHSDFVYAVFAIVTCAGASARTIVRALKRGQTQRTDDVIKALKRDRAIELAAFGVGIGEAAGLMEDDEEAQRARHRGSAAANPWLPGARTVAAVPAGPGVATVHSIAAHRAS